MTKRSATFQFAKRKSARYVRVMSAIGFSAHSGNEIEELRKAYGSLNDVTRNLASVRACLGKQDNRMAEHHLKAGEWHLDQAKKTIASVGQTKAEPHGI